MQEKKTKDSQCATQQGHASAPNCLRQNAEKGYSETGTPDVKAAEVTRGALYHHFEDKADLFRAVVEAEAMTCWTRWKLRPEGQVGLADGTRGYFEAMAKPGRVKLLLIDGPSVLGHEEIDRIDAGGGRASLRAGILAARPDLAEAELDALCVVLSAAFDRAALAVSDGADPETYIDILTKLTEG